MNNKLTQEYKDDLYEKVLEKKRVRNIKRKKMLSIFIVFISVVGFTTLGFSLLEKEDYKNFFISETENITFNDEYEYFEDLGIKLEFINIDKNTLTLGMNIKYENIADYDVDFEEIKILDENNEILMRDNVLDCESKVNFDNKLQDYSLKGENEYIYIVKYDIKEKNDVKKIKIELYNLVINDLNKNVKINMNYIKELSIEE